MGLDIYLYDNEAREAERAYDEAWDALWTKKGSGQITEAEYDEQRKDLPPYPSRADADVAAAADPSHLCNRRYLRSSYNASSFNRIVENVGADDLYAIFKGVYDEGSEEYPQKLDESHVAALRTSAERARRAAEAIGLWDRLQVSEVGSILVGEAEHLWQKPPSSEEFLAWARAELSRDPAVSFDSYSSAKGDIFRNGLTIVAAAQGQRMFQGGCALVATRADDDTVEHYKNTALIAAEFCEEAISLIERDGSCWLGWSA